MSNRGTSPSPSVAGLATDGAGFQPAVPSMGYMLTWALLGAAACGYVAVSLLAAPGALRVGPGEATTVEAKPVPANAGPVIAAAPPVAPEAQPPPAVTEIQPGSPPPGIMIIGQPRILNGASPDAFPATPAPAAPPAPPVAATGSLPAGVQSAKRVATVTVVTPKADPAIEAAPAATPPAPAVATKPAPVRAAAAIPAAAQPKFGVHVGADQSLDEVKANWAVSSAKSPALAALQPRVVTNDALGTTSYRLVAGPVASKAEATKLCAELRATGVACRIGGFAGKPF